MKLTCILMFKLVTIFKSKRSLQLRNFSFQPIFLQLLTELQQLQQLFTFSDNLTNKNDFLICFYKRMIRWSERKSLVDQLMGNKCSSAFGRPNREEMTCIHSINWFLSYFILWGCFCWPLKALVGWLITSGLSLGKYLLL